jgi:hypothetical protein
VITRVRSLRRLIRANRARRRTAAALALVVAIGVVITIVLADQSPAPANGASNGSTGSGTTTVQRRDLVETDTESGTLSYAGSRTVYNRLNGTITWLPAVGQVIKPGQALYKVGNEPVILMNGTTPAYRDLKSSDSAGQDILQLNRDLVALGFNPDGIVIDNQWQAATTAGVDLFQESLGESQTGDLTLGQIVFLPGNQLISTVDATTGSGSGSGSGTPSAYTPTSNPAPEFVSLTKTTSTTPAQSGPTGPTGPTGATGPHNSGGSTNAELRALIALLQAEIAQLQRSHSGSPSSGGHSPSSGSNSPSSGSNSPSSGSNSPSSGNSGNNGGGTATALLQTSSTQLVATVNLDASKQSEAKVGEKVTVQMPAGNTVNGRITAVSPVAQSSSNNGNGNNGNGNNGNGNNGNGNSGSSTIPVTITLSGHQTGAGLDQAAVSVNFAQAKANNVLSVPVTALLAVAGGGYAVQEAAAPHSLIPVTTGLFAAGYVEISGSGIYPGLAVTDSQG